MPVRAPRHATLGRSVRMFRSFLHEQDDPDRFYSELALDTISLIEPFESPVGSRVLDVGAGPAQFARAFSDAGAQYVGLDVDAHAMAGADQSVALVARGEQLPFADGAFDIVMSSNVMEHVPHPGVVAAEMLRTVRPGGLVLISYTAWLSPWGGHETSPWHYLGGDYAARRYERQTGKPPKNRYGQSMYAASVGQGLRWAQSRTDAQVLLAAPRYHPDWASWVVRVPGVREVVSWNLIMLLRRTSPIG